MKPPSTEAHWETQLNSVYSTCCSSLVVHSLRCQWWFQDEHCALCFVVYPSQAGAILQGLLARGKVHGMVTLVDCRKVTIQELKDNTDKHCVTDLSIIPYKNPHAWIVANPISLTPPMPHMPKQACRIWMNLEFPREANKIREIEKEITDIDLRNIEAVQKLSDRAIINFYPNSRIPYFRVSSKAHDLSEKYYFGRGSLEGMEQALKRAFHTRLLLAKCVDEATCAQLSDLKTFMKEQSLTMRGNAQELRDRMVAHSMKKLLAGAAHDKPDAASDALKENGASSAEIPSEAPEASTPAPEASAKPETGGASAAPSGGKKENPTVSKNGMPAMHCKFFDPGSVVLNMAQSVSTIH